MSTKRKPQTLGQKRALAFNHARRNLRGTATQLSIFASEASWLKNKTKRHIYNEIINLHNLELALCENYRQVYGGSFRIDARKYAEARERLLRVLGGLT